MSLIVKREKKVIGSVEQAHPIFETETTVLVKVNIEPTYDGDNNLIENNIQYDEYVIQKENFETLKRLALSGVPEKNENEETVFQVLRGVFNND